MFPRPVEILLVEDSPGDVWLTRETLLQGTVPKRINTVSNGEQAIEYLHRGGKYASAVRPDVILLDLNLPRRDGLEVLREVKSDPSLRSITVVVLTTSEAPIDVNKAYDLNANCYVVKPVDLEDFTTAIRAIEHFWMSMATLPTMAPGHASEGEGEQADSANSNGPSLSTNLSGLPYRILVNQRRRQPRNARAGRLDAVFGRLRSGR